MISKNLMKYVAYIQSTGGQPTLSEFDEDWEPIGPMLRADLILAEAITEVSGRVILTDKAKQMLDDHDSEA